MHTSPTFARWTFRLAGIYGILVLLPQYLVETPIGPAIGGRIARPEHFSGFIGVALGVLFIVSYRPTPRGGRGDVAPPQEGSR